MVLAAWLFAESTKRPEMPATSMALVLLLMLVSLLVAEPDFGQTMLILMVWGALFFIAGMRMIWVMGLAGAAGVGLFTAYLFVPHVARAHQALHESGLRRHLPGRHRDGSLLQWRLVRIRARRGHRQTKSAG